jgi:16S rRNA (uracil1498-N3)-methyltransferase
VAQADSLLLIVGPEGGIANDEIVALTDAGATPVQLGPSVLRTSTAAAVALGALGVLTPRWSAG